VRNWLDEFFGGRTRHRSYFVIWRRSSGNAKGFAFAGKLRDQAHSVRELRSPFAPVKANPHERVAEIAFQARDTPNPV
jgi:hypothetical protein